MRMRHQYRFHVTRSLQLADVSVLWLTVLAFVTFPKPARPRTATTPEEDVGMRGPWNGLGMFVLAAGLIARIAVAQQSAAPAAPASETGTLSGVVLDKTTGEPIIEAGVEIID